jgi:hypothetical protein
VRSLLGKLYFYLHVKIGGLQRLAGFFVFAADLNYYSA